MTGGTKITILYEGNCCDLTKDRCERGRYPECPAKDADCKWSVEYEDLPKEEK